MNAKIPILLALLVPCAPLAAQAPASAPTPGLLSVVRGNDGTEVFIDSASVTRSGDSTFVLSTVTRFSTAVGARRRADREVETTELDCGGERSRGLAWGLYLGDRAVSGDTLTYAWKPVDETWLPVSRVICATLLDSFAARLPLEREVDTADSQPVLSNVDEARRLARERGFPGRGRWSGMAMVRVRLGTDGVPDMPGARVVWSSRPEFSASLLHQVSVSRFTPARVKGEAVPVWMTLSMNFSVTCGNDPNGADERRATLRRTRERVVCAY